MNSSKLLSYEALLEILQMMQKQQSVEQSLVPVPLEKLVRATKCIEATTSRLQWFQIMYYEYKQKRPIYESPPAKSLEQTHKERRLKPNDKYQKFGIHTNPQIKYKNKIYSITASKGTFHFHPANLFKLIDLHEWNLYGLPDERVASYLCNCKNAADFYIPPADTWATHSQPL